MTIFVGIVCEADLRLRFGMDGRGRPSLHGGREGGPFLKGFRLMVFAFAEFSGQECPLHTPINCFRLMVFAFAEF
jgi:hypothetical protein